MSRSRRDLAFCFESLGGGSLRANGWGFGCELGFWQREAGAEPLSLLRWFSIQPNGLISGLEGGFDGIEMSFRLSPQSDGQWGITIPEYSMLCHHTWLKTDMVSEGEAATTLRRSLVFLRQKLLEDLTGAEKIFVYRTFDHVMPEEQLFQLVAALRRRGPATLLYVVEAEPHFLVRKDREGLLIGNIDRFAPTPAGVQFNHRGWDKVCYAALDTMG